MIWHGSLPVSWYSVRPSLWWFGCDAIHHLITRKSFYQENVESVRKDRFSQHKMLWCSTWLDSIIVFEYFLKYEKFGGRRVCRVWLKWTIMILIIADHDVLQIVRGQVTMWYCLSMWLTTVSLEHPIPHSYPTLHHWTADVCICVCVFVCVCVCVLVCLCLSLCGVCVCVVLLECGWVWMLVIWGCLFVCLFVCTLCVGLWEWERVCNIVCCPSVYALPKHFKRHYVY